MSNVLRQLKPEIISEQRFAMLMKSIREVRKQFNQNIAHIKTELKDFEKYAFIMYAREHLESLDRSSQVIFYHTIKNIDVKATSIVTSLSEEKIYQVLCFMERTARAQLETFDYEDAVNNYWQIKALADDLIYSYDKSDAEIVQIYNEEVAVVKILRYLCKNIFNK